MLMLASGMGRWAVSQKRVQIYPVPCEPNLLTASPNALLESFSNDDGNESAKKRNGFDKQNNNFARASRFLYISLPSLHDYGVKMPDFTFFGGRKQASTNFSFSL